MEHNEDSNEKKLLGMLAAFPSAKALISACRRVREAGYRRVEAFTPYPLHDLDKALGSCTESAAMACAGGGGLGRLAGVDRTMVDQRGRLSVCHQRQAPVQSSREYAGHL